MSRHLVLLGDSVFDNAPYVDTGQSVTEELHRLLPADSDLTLLARDGAIVRDVYDQLKRVPDDATELVLSVGGNDAVSHWSVLEEPVGQVRNGLVKMGAVVADFADEYAALLDALLGAGPPVTVCTIYEGDFREFGEQEAVNAAVALFDSAIYRAANARVLPVIDLRDICTSPSHFTQTIEPSAVGSRAIASAIARHVSLSR